MPSGSAPRVPVGVEVRARPGAPAVPEGLSALSWVVADTESGAVLASKDAHRKLPPASTLKILFALVVLPKFEADAKHTVRQSELDGVGAGSSVVGIDPGRTYRVSDLWNGVFLRSGNDAVRVLASMNGGWSATAREMEEFADDMGAEDTTVVSPDGYDAAGQASSAHDLTLLGRAGLKDPAFAEYAATEEAWFPNGYWSDGTLRWEPIHNTNRMLTGLNGVTPYPGVVGIKNGYTTHAGNTLVAAARRDGHTLIATVLNPRSGLSNAVYEEARELLDWGFEAFEQVDPVGHLGAPADDASPSSVRRQPQPSVTPVD
nr:serine hydrolase [Streptomyces sp. ISL-44]